MTLPIDALDVPTAVLEAHIARQKCIACLLIARLHTTSEAYKAALALDVALIESDAPVATDADYPVWAAALAALPTYYRARETT